MAGQKGTLVVLVSTIDWATKSLVDGAAGRKQAPCQPWLRATPGSGQHVWLLSTGVATGALCAAPALSASSTAPIGRTPRYDFVEVEEPSDGTILGRWCGSSTVPSKQISKGNQIRIRFVSDEYFSSEPGFCIHYTLLMPHIAVAFVKQYGSPLAAKIILICFQG
ncbi:Platelet-derived growth factor C [Chelonia mydas]|uniref:Platelet-derived growth factor C n=1 Tax=Chelonia mydas TaxID=8469 RepID=M7AKJ7_CHEMY|nr:Platelet-derived growth factor C [Chelonia mydas]